MKLAKLAEELATWTGTAVHLDQASCLHGRDRYSTCDACSQICPASAIEPLAPPVLESELCQDCRACLPVCPTGACMYTGRDAVDAVLRSVDVANLRKIELICEHNQREESGRQPVGLRVRGCLAGLGVAAYLELAAHGVEAIDVRLDACADCSWSVLAEEAKSQASSARRLFGLWGLGDRLTLLDSFSGADMSPRPVWQAESPPRSRRQMLAAIAGEDEGMRERGDGQKLYRERLRFVRAVRAFPQVDELDAKATSLAGMGFAKLKVDDTCTACRACARICPTEALTFVTEDDAFALQFEPQLCVACEACTHVCAPQAITVDSAPSFHDVFASDDPATLAEGQLAYCAKCGAGFADRGGQLLCPVCDFRDKNPFGSFIPPGAKLRRPRPGIKDLAESRREDAA